MRPRVLGTIIALAGWLVAGCAAHAAEPFRLIVTDLQTPLVPNSVMYLAKQLGYYENEGVSVELVRVQQTPSAVAALRAGQGDMANIATETVLRLVADGSLDLKAVVSPNKALPFLIAAKDDIAAPSDLEDHSFGIGRPGSLDQSLSLQVMKARDVDTDAVQFVALGQPSVRARALAAGRIDATTMSIGTWLSMPSHEGLHVLVPQDAYFAAAPVVSKVNVVRAATLQQRPGDVEAVIRAIVRASRDFARDPEKWVDAMAKARPDVDRADLEKLAKSFRGSWSINGGLNRKELEATEDFVFSGDDFADLMPPDLSDWVDFGPVDAALEASGIAEGGDVPAR